MDIEFEERIKNNYLGDLVSPIKDPTYVDLYNVGKSKIYVKIPAGNANNVKLGDFITLYEYKRDLFLIGKIIGEHTYDIDTDSIERAVITDHPEKPGSYELVDGKRLDNYGTPHIFRIEPLARITKDEIKGLVRSRPDFAPSSPTSAFLPEFSEIESVFNFKRDDYKLELGAMLSDDKLYMLNDNLFLIGLNEQEFRKHISLFGKTGTGKTQILKLIIYDLHKQGVSLLITDSQGDMAGMLWEDHLEDSQKEFYTEEFDRPIWNEMGFSEDNIGIDKKKITVFYPPGYISPTTNAILHHAQLNGIKIQNLHIKSNVIQSVEKLAIALESLTDAQYEELSTAFNAYMEKNGNNFDLKPFIDYIGDTTNEIKVQTRRVLLRKLNILLKKKVFASPSETETSYRDIIKKDHVSILFLQGLPKEIQTFYELLVFDMITSDKHRIDTEVEERAIIIDEAQDFIPKHSSGSQITRALYNAFDKIASQGRKFKITMIIASQRPSNIHPGVLSQTSTKIFLALDNEDVESVKRYLGDYQDEILRFPALKGIIHTSGRPLIEARFPIPPVYHGDPVDIFKKYPDIANEPTDEDQENFENLMSGKSNNSETKNDSMKSTKDDWD